MASAELSGRVPPPSRLLPTAPGGFLQSQPPPPPPQRPPHPLTASPSEAGRMKTEQVVLEFLYKAAELIVQSRVSFQSDADQRRGARRARFNLDIEEVQCVRDAMAAWREDVHLPLAISIFAAAAGGRRVLLEQWSVVYVPSSELDQQHPLGARRGGAAANPQLTGAGRDVIQQLKEVCKKISVLLRTLYAFMRLLPAHRLVRRSFSSTLSYEIHTTSSTASPPEGHFERDELISRYSFVPINTPFGYLKISAVYRLNCEFLMQEEETATQPAIFKENFIIQDYVPSSPELPPQREPPGASVSPPIALHRPSTLAALPVTDPDQFDERRRRSSPAPVPDDFASRRTQSFSPTAPVDDFANRRTQRVSRPMAIPQPKTPTVYEDSVLSPRESTQVMHAHSYGDPDRLRAVAANPNVAAAPYGYGNVAIERGNTPPAAHWTGSGRGGSISNEQLGSPDTSAALVLRRTPPETAASLGGRGAPVFASSPPFQANPTELLSTSPGYSHSRNLIREGPSSLPMFVTTDRFQLGRNAPLMLNPRIPGFSKSAGPSTQITRTNQLTQARGFSSDLYEAGSGVWGVSPDSPDAFGLSRTDPSGNYYRHRFLSNASSVGDGENGSPSQYDPDDISDLLLPFAIGDMGSNSAATTLTSTAGSEAGQPSGGEFSASDAQGGSRNGTSWDIASVGSFLNQLKNAPRLRVFQDSAGHAPDNDDQRHTPVHGDGGEDADGSTPQAPSGRSTAPQLLFEDELASFRSLRDELARDL